MASFFVKDKHVNTPNFKRRLRLLLSVTDFVLKEIDDDGKRAMVPQNEIWPF